MSAEPEVVSSYQVVANLRQRVVEWKTRAEQAEASLSQIRDYRWATLPAKPTSPDACNHDVTCCVCGTRWPPHTREAQ